MSRMALFLLLQASSAFAGDCFDQIPVNATAPTIMGQPNGPYNATLDISCGADGAITGLEIVCVDHSDAKNPATARTQVSGEQFLSNPGTKKAPGSILVGTPAKAPTDIYVSMKPAASFSLVEGGDVKIFLKGHQPAAVDLKITKAANLKWVIQKADGTQVRSIKLAIGIQNLAGAVKAASFQPLISSDANTVEEESPEEMFVSCSSLDDSCDPTE